MASAPAFRATYNATQFIIANSTSPLVYQSWDDDAGRMTYTLANGHKLELNTADCRSISDYMPRWAHLEGRAL